MNTIVKKNAILQSLESMNADEMDQVLTYIKDLIYNPHNDLSYLRFRENAMKEIAEALLSK